MFQNFLWQLPVCIKEGVKKIFHSVIERGEENSAIWGNVGGEIVLYACVR